MSAQPRFHAGLSARLVQRPSRTRHRRRNGHWLRYRPTLRRARRHGRARKPEPGPPGPAVGQLTEAGHAAHALVLDVRDADAVKAGIRSAAERLGRIDVLVNNAAGNFYVPSESLSANAWRSVIDIDLSGTFFCSQAVMPVMSDQGGGRIVSVSMTLHYRGWPLMAHATAAKAGYRRVDAYARARMGKAPDPRERGRARPDPD